MQLRTEISPAFTAPESVEHAEVLVPGTVSLTETGFSAKDGEPFGQHYNFLASNSAGQVSGRVAATPSIAVPSLDYPFLNKSAVQSRESTTKVVQPVEEVRAAPIEVWEGEVKSIDAQRQTMHVYLRSKIAHFEDHAGEIALEWVAEQDKDLVHPGAVFYWTLYKETRRGSIRNSQELRFRRLPNWSRAQLQKIRNEASKLFQDAKVARVLEDPSA